jgi:hypothetical protein
MDNDDVDIIGNDGDDNYFEASSQKWLLKLAVCYSYCDNIILAIIHYNCKLNSNRQQKPVILRTPLLFVHQLQCDTFSNQHGPRKDFHRHIRMPLESFNKLLELIQKLKTLEVAQSTFALG